MKLPSYYPFPLHLSTVGHSKNRLHPLVKFQPVRVVNFLPAPTTLEVACDLTLQTGVISAAIVLNEMRRLTEEAQPKALDAAAISLPTLAVEPLADCSRYDALRSERHVH